MAGNGCYWGWGTRGNRIAWGLVVLFVIIGTAFWIPGVIEVRKCINTFNSCMCRVEPGGAVVCADPRVPAEQPRATQCLEQYGTCMRRPAAVWGVGWFFLVVCSWIPCCYFCCCSRNPKNAAPGVAYGVQMAPMTGIQIPPGQPYGATPYGYPAPGAAYPGAPATAFPAGPHPPGAGPGMYPTYTTAPQPPVQFDGNAPVHRY